MWQDSGGQDPGGGGPPLNQEFSDLKDQCEQQQVLIAQLKEMLRKNKDQSNVTQEKVDEYMNTLTRMNARVKKGNNKRKDDNLNRSNIDIPAKSKIDLLRQQVAENKAKLAERDKSQKGIEEMVTQIQAQLDDSQQWINQTPLNLSLTLQDDKIEYNQNSSSEELYNILLIKEKRITELVNKTQKLESNILDLQENLKEKDSVIDARTKAITLMTENLSKKSKGTLDALDETKEQMRKMQENFVKLESEMKNRQMKLWEDLRLKNYEIAELQELNNKLQQNNKELLEKTTRDIDYDKLIETIQEKDNQIENLQKDLENSHDEINKLKKQLDDNNKNMIKIKAQNKSKIKELTKKIDNFKKINDINNEYVKLEAENCKLNQKIAELEEEKGNLQLKLMEIDSNKGPEIPIKPQKELNEELENKEKLLADSLLKITSLENEIASLKLEINTLTEKLNNSPKFEHVDQVKSEMKSIQFEEQLDDLRKENQQLIETNQLIINEKNERIELLLKEKQQLTQKLDNYIQENMELIDKLEKLSAEKVSSAESIEIVENLTQQEKLELEAYQKSSNNDNNTINDNNLKASDENLQQTDLNETVNELTEETSELLQKIELFTIERREVMEKMEQLKQENNNLILKMNEIENNRDILAETYEQLQNEKEELLKKFDEIQQENNKLRMEFTNNKDFDEFTDKYQRVIDENQQLLLRIEEIEMELNKIRNINDELMNEITMKQQLWESTNKENENLKLKLEELENIKNDLNKQLEKYQDDFENSEFEHRKLLESKDNEIQKLIKERDNIQSVVEDLQTTIKMNDEKFNKLTNELERTTSGEKKKIDELMNKNKEQFEKMKKIAANLKKKSQAYQELEDEYRKNQEKWVNETQEKDEKITNLLEQLNNLENKIGQFQDIEIKNTELEHKINELRLQLEKSNEISLQQELQQTKENIIDIESNENLLKSKIQELEMLLETKDTELLKSNERIMKLEEGIRFVEERRMSLEKKAIELGTELEENKQNFEQVSQNEDLLEQRLIALVEHDEIIEKRLENSISENQELNQQIIKLTQINDELSKKLEESRNNLERIHNLESRINELENNNIELERIKQNLENDLKNLQNDHDQLMIDTKDEFDKMNNDWQQQFDQMFKEKSDLMVRCERLEDELKDILDKEVSFNNEFVLYKTKLEQSETEIRNYEEQIGQLLNENQIRLKQAEEIVELQQQLEEKTNKCEELKEKIQVLEKELSNKTVENLNENQIRLKQAEEIVGLQQQLEDKTNKCEELNEKINILEKELLNKTAENTVSSIVEQAEIKVNVEKDEIPKIVWTEQSNDPFEFLTNQTIVEDVIEKKDTIPIESNKEELQNKIKTLEFMLFNVEKERDDALLQCQQLTDELTKFVYDKVTNTQRLESEIITDDQDQIDNRENLQKIEFEPTKLPIVDEKTAINEEICQQKTAYICNDNSSNNQINRDTFGETEDGWGWSPEEIKLEEEHFHKDDIGVLKDKIYVLEIERDNYIEQIKQLQIKSGKLIKKLKEFKQKNDELNRNKNMDDDLNLNQTIQDEFKLRIEQIEKRLKDTLNDLERERLEKQSLQKRIDSLITTNERMIDMKEKYEIELLSWQQNCRELNAKLERYEWGRDDGFLTTEQNIDNKTDNELTINQLNETIKELQLDNDELQKLLEEQRQLRVEAEKMKINDELKQQNQQLQDRINELLHKIETIQLENDKLKLGNDELEKLLEEQRQLRVEAEKIKINDELKQQNQQLQDRINESLHKIETIQLENDKLKLGNDELQKLLEEQRQLRVEAEKEKDQINESLHKIETIQLENDKLNKIIMEKQTIINELEKNIEELQRQLIDSNNNINKLSIERDQLSNELKMKETEINSLQLELEKLNKNIVNLNETIQLNQTEIEQLTNNLTKHNVEIELLNQQWQQQVDQRGTDVAESWKLHMETVEGNFRKEIDELETKIHTLMNENNELRKNVDIEIRNEIDRQQIIDDLTKQLQEKQKQIEYRTNEFDMKCEIIGKIIEKLHIDNNDDDNLLLLNCEKFYKDFENNCRKLEEFENRELLLKQELQQKSDTITNLTNQLQQIQNLKEYENDNIENLQQSLREYQQINATITTQLQEKNQQYEYLNNEFCNNQILLQERDREIIDLKFKLTNIEEIHEKNDLLINQQLNELDNLKQLLNNKDRDLDDLQRQLNQHLEQINEYKVKLDKFNEISNELNDKINENINLQQRIDEQNHLLDEENQQLTELRGIIEEQVIKIENLKRELYEKCNDYDSLIAEMDMNRMNEHLKIKEEYRQQIKTQQQDDDDLTEPVNRAELDLALYMLHQRDVRCEELTVELTQLLEERDTLQLRLSNAIREKEEIYKRFKIDENLIGSSSSSSNETTTSMMTTNSSDDNKHLDNKLSELKTVGYKRDKTIVDEQEMRHLQELSILQQHKDVAAKLPPEAAARLVDASYTLSRDVQSPSKVLLNWLWGKSTPKVNNI